MPRRIPVKFCGLTRTEDAAHAVVLGASWLGVIFAGGPRQVDPTQARDIVEVASPVPVIGVFGSQSEDEILRVRDRAGLAGAQLHGSHPQSLTTRLVQEGMLVLEVLRLSDEADLVQLDALAPLGVPVLVEPRIIGRLGGGGVPLTLDLALAARRRLDGRIMVLAGGLTPETVRGVVAHVGPDAVDVSSGVEQIPGVKDHARMRQFMEAVGGAHTPA